MKQHRSVLYWPIKVLKNILGTLVILAGIVMLFLPGQGLLAILIGIMLLDFPGKHQLERKLICKPKILTSINRLRKRFGKVALVVDVP